MSLLFRAAAISMLAMTTLPVVANGQPAETNLPGASNRATVSQQAPQGADTIPGAIPVDAEMLRTIGTWIVETDREIVVDRTMTWSTTGPSGSHTAHAVTPPSTTWFFAEGVTRGAFDTFFLLANPSATRAEVEIVYLRPAGAAPVVTNTTVEPFSRKTVYMDESPDLSETDVPTRITVTNGIGIIAERAVYFTPHDTAFSDGHNSAGVTAANGSWFLAEGATGTFFDTFLLIANPEPATMTLHDLRPRDAAPFVTRDYTVPSYGRLTISVNDIAGFSTEDVFAVVNSASGAAIVVERVMFWGDQFYGDHTTKAMQAGRQEWSRFLAEVATNTFFSTPTVTVVGNATTSTVHTELTLEEPSPRNATVTRQANRASVAPRSSASARPTSQCPDWNVAEATGLFPLRHSKLNTAGCRVSVPLNVEAMTGRPNQRSGGVTTYNRHRHLTGNVRMRVPDRIVVTEPFRVEVSVNPDDVDSLTRWLPRDVLLATGVRLTDTLQVRLAGADDAFRIRPLTAETQQLRFDSKFIFEVTALKPGQHHLDVIIGTFDEPAAAPPTPHERMVTAGTISVDRPVLPWLLREASDPQRWPHVIALATVMLFLWSRLRSALWNRYEAAQRPKMGF